VRLDYRDKKIGEMNGQLSERAFYFGCYWIFARGERPALTPSQVGDIFKNYQNVYPKIWFQNLGFLLCPHRMYRMIPVDYPNRMDGYGRLKIDSRDTRRIEIEIPDAMSFSTALGATSDKMAGLFSIGALETWYNNDGHYSFINEPFTVCTDPSNKASNRSKARKLVTIDNDSTDQAPFDCGLNIMACRLVSPEEGKTARHLASLQSESQTVGEHWHVVLVCATASFARKASVNVDVSGKMGPLINADPEFHNTLLKSSLPEYERLFGHDFLAQLGPKIQRSPLTHPQRCLDPSRLWLMHCNGGANSRAARDGLTFCRDNIDLFVDIIFQSTLIEIFRLQVLMEWSIHVHGEGSSELPGTKMVCSLLGFLELTIQSNSWSTMHNLLQTQYTINDGYVAFSWLSQVLQCLHDNLVQWTKSFHQSPWLNPLTGLSTVSNGTE
jgi:hypothetical protein